MFDSNQEKILCYAFEYALKQGSSSISDDVCNFIVDNLNRLSENTKNQIKQKLEAYFNSETCGSMSDYIWSYVMSRL